MILDRDPKMLIPDKKNLKNFCLTISIVSALFTLIILIRHKHSIIPTSIISVAFFILAFFTPAFLKPIYVLWMKLAFVLAWINTRLILFILFYLVFTPIGIGMRLLGIDLLDRRINKNKDSYWKKKEKKEFNPLDYERQF